jgi:hypothetical protein
LTVVSEFIPIFGGFRRLLGGFTQNVAVFQCKKEAGPFGI